MSQSRPVGATPNGPPRTAEFCYLHPKKPATLKCTRCERPICGQCAIPAAVGQHCPGCVAEARRSAPRVRSAMTATAPAVVVIVVVNVVFFLLQQMSSEVTSSLWSYPPAIAAGEWYRLLTPMLLHAGILHIALNMYVLWIYGSEIEKLFGTFRFVVVYVVSGFLGSVASYSFGECAQPSVGASGAIFGVVGALMIYLYRRRTSPMAGEYLKGLMGFVALNLVAGFVLPRIDYWAHIGGLAGGAMMGGILDQHRRARPDPTWQVINSLAVIAVGIGLVVWKTSTFSCG